MGEEECKTALKSIAKPRSACKPSLSSCPRRAQHSGPVSPCPHHPVSPSPQVPNPSPGAGSLVTAVPCCGVSQSNSPITAALLVAQHRSLLVSAAPSTRLCWGTRCGSEGLLPNADILGFALSGRTAGAEDKAGFPARPGCFHCKQQIRSGLNQTEIIPGPGDLHRCKPQPNGTQNRELPSPLPPRAWHRSCPCGRQHWGEEKKTNGGGRKPQIQHE